MKKLSLCMLAAAFLFTSCNFFVTPEDSKKDKEFEYTAENDVPASKAPFDEKLCSENAESLVLSDGDWTLNDISVTELFGETKTILKGTVVNNKIDWKSAVIKFDMSAESENEDVPQTTISDQEELKKEFDGFKQLYGDKANYITFSNGYLTDDNKVVFIANIQLDKVSDFCDLENKLSKSTKKTNPNKTKYVIPYDEDASNILYLYKNKNLNDKETIPENPPADDDDDKVDLTNIVKELDYSECKTSLDLANLTFTDGDWEIVVDETLHIGKQRAINKASVKNNKLNFSKGKAFVISELSYYSDYNDKENMFKFDLSVLGFTAKQVLMDKNYIVADLGGLTDSGLTAEEELLSTSNLSEQSNLTIKTNDNKSKYKLSFGNMMNGMYTVYFNKAGGTESEEPSENQNKPETDLKKIYTKDNDVPADKAPFNESSCPVTGKAPVFSNGNWKIVDIAEGTIYNTKAITDVAYADGKYDCSSIVVKYDFPRNGASEETVNYEGLYSSITQNGYADFLSHGYLTEEKIVLITKDKSAEFENIYLAQLNAVSAYPNIIKSNKDGTKYIIPYTGNNYLQTIYIYKEPLEDDSEADDDLGYTAPTLPESVGEDPFKGKCFINTLHGEKYDFGTDGTYIRYIAAKNNDTYIPLTKSKYSYNADSNLIYSSITEANFTGSGLLSFSEFLSVTADDDDIEMAKKEFGKSIIIKAELTSDNQLSVIEPYYIEVPELTEVTQMRANYNNTTIELLLSHSKELTIRTQRNKTKDNGTSAVFNVKTVYDIIDITEDTIIAKEKSKGEYEATDGYHPEEDYIAIALENPATIRVVYKNAKVENGLFSITISGKDSSSKLAMKADSDTSSNPTYELKSTNDHTILYSLVE